MSQGPGQNFDHRLEARLGFIKLAKLLTIDLKDRANFRNIR